MKLRYKILLLYVAVGLLILLSIGSFVSSRLKKDRFSTVYNGLQNELTHIDFALKNTFFQVEEDLNDLVADKTVRFRDDAGFTSFIEANPDNFQYAIGAPEQKIIDIFNRYRKTHKYVNSVYMGRENGSFVRSHKRARPTKYDPRTRPWYVLAKENPGQVMRTPPYASVTSSDVNIGTVKALLDKKGEVYGVVGIDITLASLTDYIENVTVGHKGYMVLLDKDGTFLASQDQSARALTIEALYKDDLQPFFTQTRGFLTVTRGDEKHYLLFSTSPELGWKLGMFIPVDEIDGEVKHFVNKIILVLFVSLALLSVLTIAGLQRFVIKPIKQLNEGSRIIAQTGDLNYQIKIKSNDEVGSLADSFNEMITSINQAESALKESEAELKKHRDHLEELVAARTAELEENQKRLEQAEERSRLLLESAGEGIFGVGQDGLVTFINPAGLAMLGFEAEEVIGRQVHALVHHTHADGTAYPVEECPMHQTLILGTTAKIDDEILWRKDGSYFPAEYSSVPIAKDGTITGSVVVFSNITERKQMENELVKAKQTADEANRAKGDFLANMSHEIRTPMNAVIGMTHLALKTKLTTKQQDYLTKIQSSANSLLGIINDILDFSKIEAGKLDMESIDFNLDEVLDNLASLVTVKAQEKKDLEVLFATAQDVPRFLVGDPLRLGQILINLANNAVKFTEQGEIVVSTELLKRDEGRVSLKFAVSDTGIGLNKEQADRLFQSFSQADTSTTRKFGGTGLGLAISKRLVEMMNGEIWVESEPGQGSTFNFTAVFGLGEEKAKRHFVTSPEMRGMKVLVVDDNFTSREIFEDMLESFSFDVTLAASGKEGLVELENAPKEEPIELVIMDWKMPGMDGIETSRRIKQHPGLKHIPAIIMVTAYGREDVMRKAEQLGLEGFLLKPVSPSILFDSIMLAFGKEVLETSRRGRMKAQETNALQNIRGAEILLVEDNEINQQVAREILEGAGLRVTLADNGQQAVDAVQKDHFDAVLMDVQMPVMDGYTATRKIREWETEVKKEGSVLSPQSSGLPIIAMTAHAMAGDEDKSLAAGMNGHVTKPIDPDQLFATLQKWIQPTDDRAPIQQAPDSAPEAPAVEKATLPDSLPGFDLAEGLDRLQGNQKLYRKLLLDFGAKYTMTAAEIRDALDRGDFDQAHSLIHNIKGLAGNLAATGLQAAAIEMEKLVKGGQKESASQKQLDQKFVELEKSIDQALKAVKTLGPEPAEAPEQSSADKMAAIPPEVVREAADRIKEPADLGDVTQIKSIAEELKSKSDAFAPLSDRFFQLADDFDFEGISKLVSELEKIAKGG
jgi:two-component system sensor histidine kinase/response regulator